MVISKEAAVGFFVLIGLICLGYLTIKLGKMELFNSDGYSVFATFTSVSGLKPGAEVDIAGVKVGRVKSIRLDNKLPRAIVELNVNNNIHLTDDAIASVKTSGLIGDKYISISPGGTGEPLKNGDEIMDTESSVDLESLISKYIFGKV
ncbi:outer membrane lipid asymmetry maintenance protein MlaD [Lawsonia intracellularis]|uniref:ABC-type transport system involved in resistance to organic solvents, periplasmic component n=1 Tax=Lawsonia intracellularis (strain PHE/MN1-00) TaxID=363253 RepID=Q1MRT7_LAWIP|nr:outer membrane lipid asymmetry maintenance protein MlaD [Lawsonia intracellularis]AGC49639.1 mammalian cell entry related domain-containing protein [Lawsonia intracellularis N343]KAA0205145.1 outer membrane lipid asymmetry maintenance protein MlaD [Lawsonia intracellularis]MBZ3892327.1 outer membrane lipid asymmetry maintenance protein MlaD [Lawsonia intracellularis]OMQ05973.1 outer membrane lipid asymmetry maintenance protein MlaD [Lawsonia intracellularis]RBN32308.1 outer membrane lipid a